MQTKYTLITLAITITLAPAAQALTSGNIADLCPNYQIPPAVLYQFPYGGSPSSTPYEAVVSSANASCGGSYRIDEYVASSFLAHFTCLPSGQGYGAYGSVLNSCPAGYSLSGSNCVLDATETCACPVGQEWIPSFGACATLAVPDGSPKSPPVCPVGVGKPIYPLTGTEKYILDLDIKLGRQVVSATYDTIVRAPVAVAGTELSNAGQGSFGALWTTSLHKKIVIGVGNRGARAHRGSGRSISFSGDGSGVYTPDADTNDRMLSIPGGYLYIDAIDRAQESYDIQGQLTRIDQADGVTLTYINSTSSTPANIAPGAGYLLSVADQFARTIQFEYNNTGRISKITDPAGQAIIPSYDSAGNLSQLTWPDTRVRKFHYENPSHPWALTGITAETGIRYATIGYDTQGRATSTELAGGVNRYSTSYTQPPTVLVSDTYDATANLVFRTRTWQAPVAPVLITPNGSTINLGIGLIANIPGVISRSQPGGSGCGAASSATTYDVNGNIASRNDFNGNRTCYASDLSRNLEISRVEGLVNTQSCATVTPAASILPAGSRKVSTTWHPDWRLQTQVAEPGKKTASVYNGQPDPFNGNTLASCAPPAAVLPDGKPIAVLCRQVEHATTDINGGLGFTAVLQVGVANREQKWTYNQYGQILTYDGPRTDVSDVTTYTYYTDTSFTGVGSDAVGHTLGDLQNMTNAVGTVTQYTQYNKHGQLLQSIDPNGVVTTYTYDLRKRLLSTTVGGQTTSYTYDPVGQLTRITRPDASWIGYEYDAAHRQTAVLDNRGNRIEYTLDNDGNKIAEQVKDPGGALRRSLARSIDALGRVQQITGKE
ncbi:MAG: hypothetical protein ABL869_03025 [Candidatus Nitrotoga sp.]